MAQLMHNYISILQCTHEETSSVVHMLWSPFVASTVLDRRSEMRRGYVSTLLLSTQQQQPHLCQQGHEEVWLLSVHLVSVYTMEFASSQRLLRLEHSFIRSWRSSVNSPLHCSIGPEETDHFLYIAETPGKLIRETEIEIKTMVSCSSVE